MGDYSKTTWVENVTKVGPTNLNKAEQGIADATKQASMDAGTAMDGTTATTNDKKRNVWRRLSDGSYLASSEGYETGSGGTQVSVVKDLVGGQQAAQSVGAAAQRILEARTKNGANVEAMRLILEAIRGGGSNVRLQYKTGAGADPTNEVYLLDDNGYSDWLRAVHGTLAARPAATGANINLVYITTVGQVFINLDGVNWTQLAGLGDTGVITNPAAGGGNWFNGYTNYLGSFRFWKDAFGYTHCVGEINETSSGAGVKTANTTIFDGFPSAYRPTGRLYFKVAGNPGTQGILINTAGQIKVDDNAANTTAYMNMGHLTWPTF